MSRSDIWKRSALIDVEASGLMAGSFPVEIGWWADDLYGDLIINPAEHWDMSKWDIDAEAMHGLTAQFVRMKGLHPIRVAARLNQTFRGKLVFSDAPEADTKWLDELHAMVGIAREYQIDSVGRLLGFMGVKGDRAYEIFDEVAERMPSRGRALVGVRYLKAVVDAASVEVSRDAL